MDQATSRWNTAIACNIGVLFDGFDFIAYSLFSVYIGQAYFPAHTEITSILLTFAVFGVAYVVRPFGGAFWGLYADRVGRRPALAWISISMAIGVALIAFTPSYAKIGIAAPIIAVIARAIQGFSAGGEFGSATAMLLECAAPKRRGLMASTQMASQGATVAIASILLLSLKHFLSPQAMQDWGWRSIFAVGMFIAPVGFYMRSRMAESPAFLAEISRAARAPGTILWSLLSVYGRELACMAGLVAIISSSFYLVMIILPVYAMRILHLAPGAVVTSTVICAAVQASMCLVGGRLSDRFGRRAVMLPACVLYAAATCALFLVLPGAAGFETLFGFQLAASICLGLLSGPFPAAISEILPVALRASGVGTVYMIVGAVFGGLSPVLIFLFIHVSGDVSCPAYWALGTAAIGIISLLFLPRQGPDGLAASVPADGMAPTHL